jgi:general secretion pathway protein J
MRGFTLLEVLIAVAILAVILLILYGTYASSMDAVQIARQKQQAHQRARIALDRIVKDLECASIQAHIDLPENIRLGMIGEDGEIFGKPSDRLDFTTLAHVCVGDTGIKTDLCEVGYHLVQDPENEGYILYRRDAGPPDDDFTEGGKSHELARGVAGLDFKFLDHRGNEFDSWNATEGEHSNTLPSIISVKLILLDEEIQENLFMTSIRPALAQRIMQ